MAGRGLRPHPTKENCLVLDFTDINNNLRNVITLKKAIPEAQLIEEQHKETEPEKTKRNFNETARKDIDQEFDILADTSFMWVKICEDEYSLSDDTGNEIVVHCVGNGFVADLFYKNGATQSLVSKPLPLEYCIGVASDYARGHLEMKFADMSAPWMQTDMAPTPGQLNLLKGKTLPFKVKTKFDAMFAIRTMIAKDRKQKRETKWESLPTLHKTH